MQKIDVPTWDAFEAQVKELRQHPGNESSPLLFRGLSDATWPLTTTLERAGHERMEFIAYYEVISRLKSEIESFTGNSWDITPCHEMDRRLRNDDGLHTFPAPVYTYMLYLRHHGFPSPLLDWTRSPYVAAYFAFRRTANAKTGKVSLYVFSETPEGFKAAGSDRPRIIRVDPYVPAHRRHFLQQSDYSICVFFEDMWRFALHQEVFSLDDPHQDVLTQIDIPTTERSKVLKLLDDHNLNAFSLFGSEESLMETMAFRTLEPETPEPPPALQPCHCPCQMPSGPTL